MGKLNQMQILEEEATLLTECYHKNKYASRPYFFHLKEVRNWLHVLFREGAHCYTAAIVVWLHNIL
jgi:hypothetical protein